MALIAFASRRRRLAAAAVVSGVTLLHMLLGQELVESRLGEGASDRAPKAIDVAFVQELSPTVPPVAAMPVAPPPAPSLTVAAAEPAASQPQPDPPQPEKQPDEPPVPSASAPDDAAPPAPLPAPAEPPLQLADTTPLPTPASAPPPAPVASGLPPASLYPAMAVASASAASAAASVTSASPPVNAAAASFYWPPSTRLAYKLEGQYRGPLHGTAQVEWLRDGPRYQVRLVVEVSPVFTRRMLSDGTLGAYGLSPRRYDEETEVTLRAPRSSTVRFEAERILLANGKTSPPLPGVQDAASQFVQMTWLFLTRPELLKVGQVIEFPLALPRRVGRWAYEVTERVSLRLPFGEIEAWRLQPQPGSRKDNELSVEMWIAPSLQYLPVRITLQQDAETHLELNLQSRPLQAADPLQ